MRPCATSIWCLKTDLKIAHTHTHTHTTHTHTHMHTHLTLVLLLVPGMGLIQPRLLSPPPIFHAPLRDPPESGPETSVC
jgi:hypothetical protein